MAFRDAMNITTAGYVGIGTTAPAEVLDVVGNIKASGTINGILSSSLNAANVSAGTF